MIQDLVNHINGTITAETAGVMQNLSWEFSGSNLTSMNVALGNLLHLGLSLPCLLDGENDA